MQTSPGGGLRRSRALTWLSYAVGAPVFAIAFFVWFFTTFGAQTYAHHPHSEQMSPLLLSCYLVGIFPFHYLLLAASRLHLADGWVSLKSTDAVCVVLDGIFWGFVLVSIGLFIRAKSRRNTYPGDEPNADTTPRRLS